MIPQSGHVDCRQSSFRLLHPPSPRPQRRGLKRALDERRRPEALVPSGGVDLILFCWERHGRTDLLVMACKRQGEQLEAFAMRPGPNDEHSLVLRAGPDAPILTYPQGNFVRSRSAGWAHGDPSRRKRGEVPGHRRSRRPVTWQRGETRGWSRPGGRIQGAGGQCRGQGPCTLDRSQRFPGIPSHPKPSKGA